MCSYLDTKGSIVVGTKYKSEKQFSSMQSVNNTTM